MGAIRITPLSSPFSLTDYRIIQSNMEAHRPTYGTYTCLEHRLTHEQIDRYYLQFPSRKDRDLYYECFLQRFRQEYLVGTLDFIDNTRSQFCSNYYKAEVYIEHIPVRLGDFTDIPYPDNLYLLRNSLRGFRKLFAMIGYFEVIQDHICINQYGEAKVWLNSDLSKNYPEDYQEQHRSQCDMVDKIVSMIQANTTLEQCPIQFSQYISKKHLRFPKFGQALSLLDQFISEYKPTMPTYCQSIFQLFKEDASVSELLSKQRVNMHIKQDEINNRRSIKITEPFLDLQQNFNNSAYNNNLQQTIRKQQIFKIPTQEFLDIETRIIPRNTDRAINKIQRIETPRTVQTFLISSSNAYTKKSPMKIAQTHQTFFYRPSIIYQLARPVVSFTYVSPKQNTTVKKSIQWQKQIAIPIQFQGSSFMSPNKIIQKQIIKTLNASSFIIKDLQIFKPVPTKQQIINKNDIENYCNPKSSSIENESILNHSENKLICYYDTGTGSQEIDPEIAADLAKYL